MIRCNGFRGLFPEPDAYEASLWLRSRGDLTDAVVGLIKRIGSGGLVFLMVSAFCGTSWGQDIKLTLGAKAWFPSWKIDLGTDEISSDLEAVVIPSIGLHRQETFAWIQLGVGRFSFEDGTICPSTGTNCVRISDVEGDLLQLETALGYSIFPWLAPFVGFLYEDQKIKYRLPQGNLEVNQTLSSAMAGFLIRSPIRGRGDVLYGKFALVGLKLQEAVGGIFEIGAAYPFRKIPLTLAVALQYRNFYYGENEFKIEEIGRTRTRDTFFGLSVGITTPLGRRPSKK